jgi:membrane fusion protein (multidrug efflux system)
MNRNSFVSTLAVLSLACGGGEASAPGGQGGGPRATAVEVAEAFRDTVVDAIVATGGIEAVQRVSLRPDFEGRVVELLFREGKRVAAGTPMIRLDAAELQAEADQARAERDLALQSLDRTRELLASNAAAAADFERAEASSRAAAARLSLLELRIERAVVRAPFSGVVGQRLVSLGDFVNSQTELLTITTVSPQRAVFTVPERYASSVRVGQVVTFQVAALPGRTFTGRVEFVDPVVTLPARSILVKAIVNNPDGALQPGMFIEARLATETRSAATIVPEEAIDPSAAGSFVWVVADGSAVRRPVELGVRTPGFVEIRSGVTIGELVVVGGIERLYEGASVAPQVVERRPQGAKEE